MRILVGYDGSNVSKEAVKTAVLYAQAFQARIYVLMSMVGGPDVPREDFAKNEQELDYIQSTMIPPSVESEVHLSVRGFEPGEDIVSFAKDNRIDLIIVGVKRRSKVGKLVFGSNAQYIILKAPCPVMSVK
ncbi:MAG: universal stress protein [Desulfatirhabdiaceae bacterium]